MERSSTGVDGPEGSSQAPHPSSSVEAPGGPTLTEDPHKSEPAAALDGPFTTRQLLRLDEALRTLTSIDERKSRVVELRFFGGLSVAETAAVLDVSADTVMRDWKLARAWLQRQLRRDNA